MKIFKFIRDFAITLVIVFITSMIVSFLYSLIVHGSGSIDWEASFRFAVIFGIVFPTIRIIERRQKD